MLTLKPELQKTVHIPMKTTDSRHIGSGGVVGFSGSFDHGGSLTGFGGGSFGEMVTQRGKVSITGQGAEIAALGRATGGAALLQDGVYGPNNGGVSFSEEMLKSIDKVSTLENRASALAEEAITNPGSIDAHDLTIAEAEASMALNIARTILNRLTQAWRDVINAR
ncbi:MAG: flagellar hook-basal body complex protein FliE [Spirochaetaceae bacterium]|nr:flagellar hook-basal body complex protein FliE [Spirochaetaceae bacterium]